MCGIKKFFRDIEMLYFYPLHVSKCWVTVACVENSIQYMPESSKGFITGNVRN